MDYSERWALEVMAPIMLMFPFMVLAAIADDGGEIQIRALNTLSVVASISFIWGVTASMEIWACTEDEASGEDRLNAATEVTCEAGNQTYDILLAFSILLFLFYFFFLQAGLAFIANKPNSTADSGSSNPKKEKLNPISGDYKDDERKNWWFFTNMYKFVAVLLALYSAHDPRGQVIALLVFTILSMIATLMVQPYKDYDDEGKYKYNNEYDIVLHCTEILKLIIATIIFEGGMGDEAAAGCLFAILAIDFVILMFGARDLAGACAVSLEIGSKF